MKRRLAVFGFWLSVFLAIGSGLVLPPAVDAQFGGTQPEQMQMAARILKNYCKEKGHLPYSQEEMDDVLIRMYTQINGNPPDFTNPNMAGKPATQGPWRILDNVRIKLDGGARNAPISQWRRNPPDNWIVPWPSIVIVTDGQEDFYIWSSGTGTTPIVDASNQAIIISGHCERSD
jgi:hypothetical protein